MPVVVFLPYFCFTENPYQTESKHSETFCGFFLGQKTTVGRKEYQRRKTRWATHTWPRQPSLARSGVCWPTTASVPPPLSSINSHISRNPRESLRNTIPAAASSRTTRSNLDTISGGFTMSIGASPMMRE